MCKQLVLLLGSNLGDKKAILKRATVLLEKRFDRVVKKSGIYASEPWGFDTDNWFVNQVLVFTCGINVMEVLKITQAAEKQLGRRRKKGVGYQSREVDIDILFYGSMLFHSDTLTLPHPRLHERRFTLLPLAEVLPQFIHPGHGLSIDQLLKNCTDSSLVTREAVG